MYTVVHARIVKIWLQNDFLFQLSPYWKEHEEGKKVILGFMEKVSICYLYSSTNRSKSL